MRNAYTIVEEFEKRVAHFAGARYGVAVDSGTAALFLSAVLRKMSRDYSGVDTTIVPYHTYISVPFAMIQAGYKVKFKAIAWQGTYEMESLNIIDGAKRFCIDMFEGKTNPHILHCLSFHAKKHIPIGRGGMILTNDEVSVEMLQQLRYDGRRGLPMNQESVTVMGYNMYMTPEQAARGMMLMDAMLSHVPDDLTESYPHLYDSHPVFWRLASEGKIICA